MENVKDEWMEDRIAWLKTFEEDENCEEYDDMDIAQYLPRLIELRTARSRLAALEEIINPNAWWVRNAVAKIMELKEPDETVWDIMRTALAAAMKEVPQ